MDKSTLVILPGWGGTRETWADFIELAKDHFTVVCIELPCFGNEPCPSTVWGVEEYADFVKTKINDLRNHLNQNEKITILAHSFGGQVATYLVGTNAEICDTLILSGPAIFRAKTSLKQILLWPITKMSNLFFVVFGLKKLQKMARRFLYRAIRSPDYNLTSGIERAIFKKIITEDVSAYVSRIPVPTLVIAGKRDSYVPWKASKKAASLLPHGAFTLINDGKHGLHHTHPEKIISMIIQHSTRNA